MTNWDVFRAVGGISDELIEDAGLEPATPVKPRKPNRRRVIGAVAALAACAALVLAVWKPSDTAGECTTAQDDTAPPAESAANVSPDNGVMVPAPPYEGVYIPPAPMPEAPEPGTASDMVAFFIYNGRLYTQTGQYAAPSLRDGYICSVTGDIDEWSDA